MVLFLTASCGDVNVQAAAKKATKRKLQKQQKHLPFIKISKKFIWILHGNMLTMPKSLLAMQSCIPLKRTGKIL